MTLVPQRATAIERTQAGWPSVLVAGAYQTGVVLMRDLRRRGVHVEAIDCNPLQPGFKTVYGRCHLCPNPDIDPDSWVVFMRNLANRMNGKPVIIPSADQFVSALADHAETLSHSYTFHSQGLSVQCSLATKERQYEIAVRHGLPAPRTTVVSNSAQLESCIHTIAFPCLLKPIHFREWERFKPGHPLLNMKIAICKNEGELRNTYELASKVNPTIVVQEIISGPDSAKLVYLGCLGQYGNVLGSCLLRQLRTYPINYGSASVVEPIRDEDLEERCNKFLQETNYVGICELELKRDMKDNVVRLIEINPRYSVTSDASRYAGIELGWLHYLDLIGMSPERARSRERSYRHVVLRRDFACLPSYRNAKQLSMTELFRSYRPPVYFFDFDLRDWRVTWETLVILAKTALSPVLRRFLRRRT